MVRLLIRLGIFLGSAALALGLAALLVHAFHLEWAGLLVAIVVFAIVQAALDWLVRKVFGRSAPAVAGVAGLLSTFLALWIASLFPGGVTFDGIGGWILAAVVVWLTTAVLGWLGARYLLRPRERASQRKDRR